MGPQDSPHTKLTEQDTQAIRTAYRAAADHLLRQHKDGGADLIELGFFADKGRSTRSEPRTRWPVHVPAAAVVAAILAVCIALAVLTQGIGHQCGISLPAALWSVCFSPWWRSSFDER